MAETLIERLVRRASESPDRLYARFLFPDGGPAEMSYEQMLARTRQFASTYAASGVSRGDVVPIILQHHPDMMPALLGATWLGAVPAFLPFPTAKLDPRYYFGTLRALIEHSGARVLMTYAEFAESLRSLLDSEGLLVLVQDEVIPDLHPDATAHVADDIALIQYSSGTTGLQKGALLSHHAIIAEMTGVERFFELTDSDSFLTWMPLYHDWALVCVALHALWLGTHFSLLSPLHWIRNPSVALKAISTYRPTVYLQPNFAFNYMARRIEDEQLRDVDLSSIRICCNGAEPCLYRSHEAFVRRFRQCGLREESLSIVYGMAEVTNSVFAAGPAEPIRVDVIDGGTLQTSHRAMPVGHDHPEARSILGVGRPLEGTSFLIIGPDNEPIPDREVGQVAIRSEARYGGYHNNPEATDAADHDGWYLTGDLGYRVDDHLFVTGRLDDLIIAGGVNIYPLDVESIVSEHPQAIPGRNAAVGAHDGVRGTDALIVLFESRSDAPDVVADIIRFVRSQVPSRLGVAVDRIIHVPHRWLIKTSSGKMARTPNLRRVAELGVELGV